MPRVSICIPAYKPDFFEVALKSAIAQSFTDTEIIISDDCPTDAIEKICERYASFISYSRNPKPGEVSNVTRLGNLASGEYIKYLFDDDVINPFCVQFLLEAMEQTRNLGTKIAFSPRYFINEHNHITSLVNHFKIADELKFIDGKTFIKSTAITHMNLIGEYSGILLRREDCFDQNGVFDLIRVDEDGVFRGIMDLTAWVKLARSGGLIGHPHPLSYFRQHSTSTSNPAANPVFINGVLAYETIMDMAQTEGYLTPDELMASMQRLMGHYHYWLPTFPEVGPRIERLAERLAALS